MASYKDVFWLRLKKYPPILVRLLAKDGTRPLTDNAISERSGLSIETVVSMSQLTSWDRVEIGMMRKFWKGCGVDLMDRKCMRKIDQYIKHNPAWRHLKRGSNEDIANHKFLIGLLGIITLE